jgi:hypothetical protein
MAPSIVIPLTTENQNKAEILRFNLFDAVRMLDVQGAWPTSCGPIEIKILNNGQPEMDEGVEETRAIQMLTLVESSDKGMMGFRKIRQKSGKPAKILVSVDLFDADLALDLLNAGATENQILVHFLAHEIHHLTEVERVAAGGFLSKHRSSGLVAAYQGEMEADWNSVIKKLWAEFPDRAKSPREIFDGAIIADEVSADLIGLYWLGRVGLEWVGYSQKLLECRKIRNPGGSSALASNIGVASPMAPGEVYVACWQLAITRVLECASLSRRLRRDLESLVKLELTMGLPIANPPAIKQTKSP